jgi:hypothetical protein
MIEKIKENYFCFYKKKGYRYEDELGSKKIATVPRQRRQKSSWYFVTEPTNYTKLSKKITRQSR